MLASMNRWTVILTGVVAGVAAGPSSPHWWAASAGTAGGARVGGVHSSARYGRRREMKAKEAEARSFERTPRAGAHQVVRELRGNADVAKHCEDGYHAPQRRSS
jgi:hypothetical protein